jgi:asparagine synthetase B (glutamine-hydrolysing)
VPFLDHTFVEFAMSIPDRFKIRRHTQKYILKKAVRDSGRIRRHPGAELSCEFAVGIRRTDGRHFLRLATASGPQPHTVVLNGQAGLKK